MLHVNAGGDGAKEYVIFCLFLCLTARHACCVLFSILCDDVLRKVGEVTRFFTFPQPFGSVASPVTAPASTAQVLSSAAPAAGVPGPSSCGGDEVFGGSGAAGGTSGSGGGGDFGGSGGSGDDDVPGGSGGS